MTVSLGLWLSADWTFLLVFSLRFDVMLRADAMWVARSLLGGSILVLMTGLGVMMFLGVPCLDESL